MKSFRSRGALGSNGAQSVDFGESLPYRARASSPSGVNPKPASPGERLMQRVLILCGICLILMISSGIFQWVPEELEEHRRVFVNTPTSHLTVMLNTYKRPPEVVEEAIEHYKTCDTVRYIYVVWSDRDNPPPTSMLERYGRVKHDHMSQVGFKIQESTSLNNRFKPLDGAEHTDAIFAVDDDMRVSCRDLALAFEVWKSSPRSLVGFMPRVHLRDRNGVLRYRCWWSTWWHGVYSIILTKAAILHHDYLEMYTTTMPLEVRALVDRERNCEDLAMQFLISNSTGLPPIYVKGHLKDLGALNGISTSHNVAKSQHMDTRSKCLNELTRYYGGVTPLVTSHNIVNSAADGWVYSPSTAFEYISSDLWAGWLS